MQIELLDIHKRFGAVHANRGVSLRVLPGTIHGVLGENGAGKSTLMKILAGYLSRTSGQILLDGREVELRHPADATRQGIGMLYQDPLDFASLTVLENYMLGLAPRAVLDPARYRADLTERARELGFALDPDHPVERLTVGERQQLELLRLLALGVRTLILDEPTTGISSLQKEALFGALRRLAAEGRSILLVSHKLEDIEALCDRATVLRQGAVTGSLERPFESRDLLELMFGTAPAPPPRTAVAPGEPLLELRGVTATGGRSGLLDCDAVIRAGELVGLAGIEGSGQGVFLRVAAGLRPPRQGEVRYRGRRLSGYDHHAQRRGGVTFLPAGRLEEGLVPGLTLAEHFALNREPTPFLVPWRGAAGDAAEGIRRFRIRGKPDFRVESLSGGNQQRLLLSLIPPEPTLLLLENPTRGLDLESAHEVWKVLQGYRAQGATVVFSSAELDEILLVADRVLVFYNGSLVLDTPATATTPAELGRAIAGRPVPAAVGS